MPFWIIPVIVSHRLTPGNIFPLRCGTFGIPIGKADRARRTARALRPYRKADVLSEGNQNRVESDPVPFFKQTAERFFCLERRVGTYPPQPVGDPVHVCIDTDRRDPES